MGLTLIAAEGGLTDLNIATVLWAWVAFGVTLFALKKVAWPMLAAKMEEREVRIAEGLKKAEEAAERKELAGDVKASWGEQMRSYVLHPYQMVKDLRTGFEVGNTSGVFDGDIDGFIEAGIRWQIGQDKAAAAAKA